MAIVFHFIGAKLRKKMSLLEKNKKKLLPLQPFYIKTEKNGKSNTDWRPAYG
jgi:hypothetical protein